MAGQKLSPRQKMINMMYLVLTALLALNVSSEILQAFESLRQSLENSNGEIALRNEMVSKGIVLAVDKEISVGKRDKEWIKGVVSDISAKTLDFGKFIAGIRTDLEKIGGQENNKGPVIRMDETEANYRYWMGSDDLAHNGRGNGKALELRQKLNSYVEWANKVYEQHSLGAEKSRFHPMAVEPSYDPTVVDPEAKNKTWEYYTFHGKPVIADLAMVEKFKMDAQGIEAQLLQLMKSNLNDELITVDTLFASEAPFSNTVAAGMDYQTRVFISSGSKSVHPEFAGMGIQVSPDGNSAMITLKANGGVIPDGKNEGVQSYTALIKVPLKNGKYKELPLKGEFTVRRPEMVVTSKVIQILYRDCANTVDVDVPALGDQYRPDFSKSVGGKAIPSSSSIKEVTLVPTAKEFKLVVYSNTNGQSIKIGDRVYTVIDPPKPELVLQVGGSDYDLRKPLSKAKKVTIKVRPNPDFRSTMGKDAKYVCTKVKLIYAPTPWTTVTIAEKTGDINSGIEFDLNVAALRQASGNNIYFEVEGLKRKNFEGKIVTIPGLDIYDVNLAAKLN